MQEPRTHEFQELLDNIEEVRRIVASIDKRVSTLESTGSHKKPTLEACKLYGAKIGLPDDQSEWFFNFYNSNGWKVGKNRMVSWESAMLNWRKEWQLRGNGAGKHNVHTPTMFELKTALEATQRRMKELADKSYNDSGAFHEWTNEPDRQEFILLKRKAKELEAKIRNSI